MFKKLFTALLLLFAVSPKEAVAQVDFEQSAYIEYKVEEDGKVFVTGTFTIKNIKSNSYPKKFLYRLESVDPENIKAYETGRKLDTVTKVEDGVTILEISFADHSVGKGASKTFVVTYESSSLARRSGEVWEVYIPKDNNKDTYKDYKAVLSVPKSWEDAAYMSPDPQDTKKLSDRTIYIFGSSGQKDSQIIAGFGKFQTFSFSLTYNLENTSNKAASQEIALPPDTSTQFVYYESIEPKPANVRVDSDGNWIASYNLSKNQKMVITALGVAQIFASPKRLDFNSDKPVKFLLAPSTYWQSDDPGIRKLAMELKTPEAIYKYVSENLKYDYGRISQNYERLGAKQALSNPEKALCMEYTDLFIALSRAAGIPAREINGYAYSQSDKEEPLSLVADVLHSWPEYWDETERHWVPIDPTWAATTGGTDFFGKFDLNHFAFVIHGQSDVMPYSPGSYKLGKTPEKDVIVTFGKLPENKLPRITTKLDSKSTLSVFSRQVDVTVENSGKSAIYNTSVNVETGNSDTKKHIINVMPPYSKSTVPLTISYGVFGIAAPEYIKVLTDGGETDIPTNKTSALFTQLILLLLILLISLGVFQFYHKVYPRIKNKKWSGIFK